MNVRKHHLDRLNHKLSAIEDRIRLLIKRAQSDQDEALNRFVTRLEQRRIPVWYILRSLRETRNTSEDAFRKLWNSIATERRIIGTQPVTRDFIDYLFDFMTRQSPEVQRAFRNDMTNLMSNLGNMTQDEQENVLEAVRAGIAGRQQYDQQDASRQILPRIGERLTTVRLSPTKWLCLSKDRNAAWLRSSDGQWTSIDDQLATQLLRQQQPNLLEQARKNMIVDYISPYGNGEILIDEDTREPLIVPPKEQRIQHSPGSMPQQPVQQNMQPFAPGPTQLPTPGPTQPNMQPFIPRQTPQNMQPFAPKPTQLPAPGPTQRQGVGRRIAPSY